MSSDHNDDNDGNEAVQKGRATYADDGRVRRVGGAVVRAVVDRVLLVTEIAAEVTLLADARRDAIEPLGAAAAVGAGAVVGERAVRA